MRETAARAPLGLVALCAALAMGCPAPGGPAAPASPPLPERTFARGVAGMALTSVAGTETTLFASFAVASPAARSVLEAIPARGAAREVPAQWRVELEGIAGRMAIAGGSMVAAIAGTGSAAGRALRGEPGAVLVALDAATGARQWTQTVDATAWATVTGIAPLAGGVVVAGAFAGTLRIGDRVVSSAGRADGFVARLAGDQVRWLVRLGGPGADAVQGVAVAGEQIAIAGVVAPGAELRGRALPQVEPRARAADGFVGALDLAGDARWVEVFGGKEDTDVAGVAIDARGRVAVAATVRGATRLGIRALAPRGAADGLVAWWSPAGALVDAALLGGAGRDELRAICAADAGVIVAGTYAGALTLGARALSSTGDDAFLAALEPGAVRATWPIGGDGREEIAALAAIPGGFVAGVAHTAAANLDGVALPAPDDPLSGTALLVRPARGSPRRD